MTHKAFLWCESSGLLYSNIEKYWIANPTKITSLLHTYIIKELHATWDYYDFVDESWSNINNIIKSGIGGYLRKKNIDLMFIFSGLVQATNPLEAETLALFYMIKEVRDNITVGNSIVIHTDSYNLWHIIQKFRAGHIRDISFISITTIGDFYHVSMVNISRD